jgi:hypothetical protein
MSRDDAAPDSQVAQRDVRIHPRRPSSVSAPSASAAVPAALVSQEDRIDDGVVTVVMPTPIASDSTAKTLNNGAASRRRAASRRSAENPRISATRILSTQGRAGPQVWRHLSYDCRTVRQ